MTKPLFNAALSLGDWDPAAQRAGAYDNVFEEGREYTFHESGETKEWTKGVNCAMVEMDNGRRAHSYYVASCMVIEDESKLILNTGKDPKFICAHTPFTAKAAGLDLPCMKDFVSEKVRNGAFPRVRAKKTLPTAVAVADLKTAGDDVKKNYAEYFGLPFEEIIKGVEYLPSVKRATTGTRKGSLFNSTRTLMELAEDAKRVA